MPSPMISTISKTSTLTRDRTSVACILLLICAPFIARAPQLLGILIADPTLLYAGIARGIHAGPFGGYPPYPTIDPNIAFTSHALGYRAAMDVLNGSLPWWNHFEAAGVPLAGEMQAAALFPLTLLLVLHNGQIYMHIVLQVIAGISTYALMRKMGCTRLGAVLAGLVFQFNGTYAWLANAVINPIAFMPLTLLGIETLRENVSVRRMGGAAWVTIGLAASLYAGFPEVAYVDGLLILMWTLVRSMTLAPQLRWKFLGRVVIAGTAALAISAPILVAFADYLLVADTGGHSGGAIAFNTLSPAYLLAMLVPYAFGGIFQVPAYTGFWAWVGGYTGCILLVIAIAGLRGSALRGLRIALLAWISISLGLAYGMPGLSVIAKIIPGLKYVALFRYLPPSWEFCLAILAALALSDLNDRGFAKRIKFAALIVAAACIIAAAITHLHHLPLRQAIPQANKFALFTVMFIACALVAVFAIATWVRSPSAQARAIAAIAVIEAILFFIVPTLSAPSRGTVATEGIRYLQEHMGFQRFVTLGPVQPNYGSYFGIAAVNHNDLPIPLDWTRYVSTHLDSNAPPILFTGVSRIDPSGPTAADSLIANIASYQKIGVGYMLVPHGMLEAPTMASLRNFVSKPENGVRQVFSDDVMKIFALPAPAPYFDATGCALKTHSRDTLEANCSQPAHLRRLEQFMPGWSARVNGAEVPVERVGDIFQEVSLPAGSSLVEFKFAPPYIEWAYVAFLFGVALFALGFVCPKIARPTSIRH